MFFSRVIVKMKTFGHLGHHDGRCCCIIRLDTLFGRIQTSIATKTSLTLPNTMYPFFITLSGSINNTGCVLFQLKEQRKLYVVCYVSSCTNMFLSKILYYLQRIKRPGLCPN